MLFLSTRGKADLVCSAHAITRGLAGDGGLFVPQTFPAAKLDAWRHLSYPQLAAAVLGSFLTEYDPAFLEDFETTELAALIGRTLDEESKTFLYLQYVYGYKGREIAEMYGVTDTYVRKKIQYAKEKLKKALTGDGENG